MVHFAQSDGLLLTNSQSYLGAGNMEKEYTLLIYSGYRKDTQSTMGTHQKIYGIKLWKVTSHEMDKTTFQWLYRSTMKSNIKKWKVFGRTQALPGSGLLSKLDERAWMKLAREVTKRQL